MSTNMDLFVKLFTTTRRKLDDVHKSRDQGRAGHIRPDQVRVLLYKECDRRGRKVLFDSSTIEEVVAGKNDKANTKNPSEVSSIVEVSNGFSYIYGGPAPDSVALGEMIFGAAAINHRGASLKLHYSDEPKRLMCTKIFVVGSARRGAGHSAPSDLSPNSDKSDSGFFGGQSARSSVSSGCELLSAVDVWDAPHSADDLYHYTNGGISRRLSAGPPHNSSGDSQAFGGSSASSTSDSISSAGAPPAKRRKLGLALIITFHDHQQMSAARGCLEHSGRLELALWRLRAAASPPSAASRLAPAAPSAPSAPSLVSALHRATRDTRQWLQDLLYGPRIQSVWQSLATASESKANKLAERLLADLCHVIAVSDTKHTNFFFSSLLSAVLTYHVGWVRAACPEVAAAGGAPSPRDPRDPRSPRDPPGGPPARTVVAGRDAAYIARLLLVLTYFIREDQLKLHHLHFPRKRETFTAVSLDEGGKKTATRHDTDVTLKVPESWRTAAAAAPVVKRTTSFVFSDKSTLCDSEPMTSQLKRNTTVAMSLKSGSNSSLSSDASDDAQKEREQRVLFVLGDDEKLVGLKNKSSGGKRVKKSSNVHNEPITLEEKPPPEPPEPQEPPACEKERCTNSPSKCCGQSLPHSRPIKHSGFKFEFDKYPQIVTNYMKSKNLEILDRHYIGKPGNLKLDNFQFDPTIVAPIQEERCETCVKCEMMESLLQTPTNASELEYTNGTPQYATPVVQDADVTPKTYVRRKKLDTVVVNVTAPADSKAESSDSGRVRTLLRGEPRGGGGGGEGEGERCGHSLLGGLTDHYVPDLILQGCAGDVAQCRAAAARDVALRRRLLAADTAATAAVAAGPVAILADTDAWEVRVCDGMNGAGAGPVSCGELLSGALDVLPALRRAKLSPALCLQHVERRLRAAVAAGGALRGLALSAAPQARALCTALRLQPHDLPLLLAATTSPATPARPALALTYS